MVFFLSQDSLAGPARQSTARMELEGPQGPREKQADQAYQAPWGCQAFVSLRPALEPQPTPLHASRSLDPSKGHEHEARTEPGGHPGGKGLGSSGWTCIPSLRPGGQLSQDLPSGTLES